MTVADVAAFTTPVTVVDGVNTYTYSFDAYSIEHVRVQVTTAAGVISFLTYGTDYSVVAADAPAVGGTVTITETLTAGDEVVLFRDTSLAQTTELPNQGPFFAETVERELDRQTMVAQEQARDNDLALSYPLGSTANAVFPEPVEDRALVGRSVGGEVVYKADGPTVTELSAVVGIADDVTAVAAIAADVTTAADNIADIQAAPGAATAAANAQTAAEAARDATLTAYDNFDDRYLGAKAADPTVDNDGDPLAAGMLYFNSTTEVMMLYTGAAWVAAYVSGAGYLAAANDLSDVASAATARTNLDVYDKATVDAKAPRASPALTGIPTVPTAVEGTNTTQAASTEFVQTALGGVSADEWASQPIGAPIPLFDNITGVDAPPTDQSYRYVLLTAGEDGVGGYNEGLVTSESVSGSSPNIDATFAIDDTDSPIDGQTVRLLNTTREFIRPGDAGTIQDSQNLAHTHSYTRSSYNKINGSNGSHASSSYGSSTGSSGGDEARPSNIGLTYYMRIK